jgi:hypothetical protein
MGGRHSRVFATACACEVGNDLDHLPSDPAFELAGGGRLTDAGRDLGSQPSTCRLEKAPHPCARRSGELHAGQLLDGQLRAPARRGVVDMDRQLSS